MTDFKSNFIFPKRLKSLRQESGLKQQEIASLLGIKQKVIEFGLSLKE
ncbi:helix-turn-helix domain-containing protein [Streptococcus uberis]|nr:helix-turn-helix transcriptional regulator [Streptococcus uberis]MCK1255112.1 helix-turn-helix domain-containing protein [Streptococcus uberis]